MDVKKDKVPVIYKQDIMDDNGKLNVCGALLLIGSIICAFQIVGKFLADNIVDKDKVN